MPACAEEVDTASEQTEMYAKFHQHTEVVERERLEHCDHLRAVIRAAELGRKPEAADAVIREHLDPLENFRAVLGQGRIVEIFEFGFCDDAQNALAQLPVITVEESV